MLNLKNLLFTDTNGIIHVVYTLDGDSLKIIKLNNKILRNAFKNDTTTECVLLDSKVSVIELSAFENCSKLQIVEYVEHKEILTNEDGKIPLLKATNVIIQKHAFKNCGMLHTVIFPNSEENGKIVIEKEAFLGCKELRTIVLRGNGFDIADDAFKGCDMDKLVFVVSPDSSAERFAREHSFRFVCPDNIQ